MYLLLLAAIALLIILPLTLSFSLYSLRYLRYSQEEIANTAQLNVVSARRMTEMYQDTITQAATLVLSDPALSEIASIRRLEEVRGSFDTYQRLSRAVSLLTSMTYIGSLRIDSVYVYVDGADYVITSDLGAVRLSQFTDEGYREVYERLVQNPHSSIWTVRKIPISTISGDTVEMANYVTYANMANPIVSKVRGAIFVNIRETTLFSLTNTSEFDKGGQTFIVDANGVILSHLDKSRILASVADSEELTRLLGERGRRVAIASSAGGGREALFVSAYSAKTSWTFVSEHSLDALTDRIRKLMRTNILVIFIIVLVGSGVVVFISSRISIPLRKLMRSLSQWNPPEAGGSRIVNEFEYLLDSFQRIKEHEAILRKTIDEGRDKLWEPYIVDLLRGDLDKHVEEPFPVSRVVPPGGYVRVFTVSFDKRSEVESRFSQEQRVSYLSLLSAECEKVFAERRQCVTALIDGNVSVILGSPKEDGSSIAEIEAAVGTIQERFARVLGSTLTVGISDRHQGDLSMVSLAYDESLDAIKHRIVEGYGKVHVWEHTPDRGSRYPYEAETMLLNSLHAGDLQAAESALGALFSSLGEMSCDDILHSVDHLCAILAGLLGDSDMGRAGAGARGIFDELARRETIWEKKALIADLCRIIAIETGSGGAVLVDTMLDYVRANFRTIIDFEAMAQQVGISYSYMRKLMKDHTGRGILEHVHFLRIEEAGRLLSKQDMPISAIARHLGYNNIQSFERFFKKHKGVSAHEYRRLLRTGALPRP